MKAGLLLRDSLFIVALGVAVGLIGNALSPRGLSLTRDYFEAGRNGTATSQSPSAPALSRNGYPLAGHDEVVAWFRDPAYVEKRIIFVDARNDALFARGHVPGAYPFDHYRPEQHLASTLAAAQFADRVVVYCQGGTCEDSDAVASDLEALGVARARLVIYAGGMSDWQRHELPIEKEAAGKP